MESPAKVNSVAGAVVGVTASSFPKNGAKEAEEKLSKKTVKDKKHHQASKVDQNRKRDIPGKESEKAKEVENDEKTHKVRDEYVDKKITIGNKTIAFEIDRETEEVIVMVIDPETGEEKRIPPDELKNLAKQMENYKGRILNHTVPE